MVIIDMNEGCVGLVSEVVGKMCSQSRWRKLGGVLYVSVMSRV